MDFYVLTLFPEMITGGLYHSIIKRAIDSKLLSIQCVNIRDFANNKHNRVDDYPYGGGAGMVMQPQPVYDAYQSLKNRGISAPVLYMTPAGKPFSQKTAARLAKNDALIILCGHYEGIDERVIDEIVTEEISLGDFILTGGEIAAMAVIDSVSRLLPNVLGNSVSREDESFSASLLEYPQYTRPAEFLGRRVPDVLLSGHHANVENWRREQAIALTKKKRPDLLDI